MNELSEPKVEILMATYNGEKYLRKQLDSILNQTYQNWMLLVRDDGSSDKTVEILNEYAKKDSRITVILNTSDVHGWQQNFQSLIIDSPMNAVFYMFCDQDDIWMKEKIAVLGEHTRKKSEKEPNKPMAVYADMAIIDQNDDIEYESFDKLYNIRMKQPVDSFFSQRVYGCNMMMNTKAMTYLKAFLNGRLFCKLAHDGLAIKLIAAANGNVVYLNQSLMQYRRSGENATASQNLGNSFSNLKTLRKKSLARRQASTYIQSVFVVRTLLEEIPFHIDRKLLEDLLSALCKGGIQSLKIWNKYHIDCGSKKRNMLHLGVLFSRTHIYYINQPELAIKNVSRENKR